MTHLRPSHYKITNIEINNTVYYLRLVVEPSDYDELNGGAKKRFKKVKDRELMETVEEVFDYRTLMALYRLINKGVIDRLHGVVAAGKEARIYWGEDAEGNDLAVKIFLVQTGEFRRGMLRYIEGDPRFRLVRRDRRHIINVWCSKEFKNLRKAYEVGVKVPKPIDFKENVLVMEFIDCGERGKPAPLLKDAPPDDPEKALYEILNNVRLAFKRGRIVHADLSEYNIMNKSGEFYIIDWGSAVSLDHPEAINFLKRDLRNLLNYFKSLGVRGINFEDLEEYVMGTEP